MHLFNALLKSVEKETITQELQHIERRVTSLLFNNGNANEV